MAVSIYCHMEKIIYCYTIQNPKRKLSMKEKAGEWLAELLCLPYPIMEKEGCFLDYPVVGYAIEGMAALPENGNRPGISGKRTAQRISEKRAVQRAERTLEKLKKQIRKREMQGMPGESRNAFLFLAWEEGDYPPDLLTHYYTWQRKENAAVRQAEQLIVLDCQQPEADEIMTFVSQICGDYNYVTIVTERKEVWEPVAEEGYEEYGVSLRCVSDNARLCFREKKTLVLDWGKDSRKCLRNLPKDSVYMDFYRAEGKRHVISVKCREIPYLSPHNALDTVLKDTV